MRNLKKILAMVLALVMSLSLMATAGAADFPDASSINEKYETAIEVLEGLGVFKGYQDGTFQPQGSITRAETAAIIYRIVTGDVKDEQVGIYADYNLFTDVPSTSWFAGYVNYCANAEYIKGVGGGKFNPNAQVTGYAALAMILRAIGYTANGGFTGSDWEVQTARTAESRKITKNIMTGTLGQNANRETVAEILFQAILVNMVDHNILNTNNGNQGYTEIDETLGYKTFKLEQVEGVVTANEFADLYSNQVLNEGLTNLEVAEDDIRSLAITTEITDIGESRYAYITGSKVLAMGDTGNNKVTEFGHACDITTTAKFNAVAEMPKAADIEFYVDFDRSGYWTSDFRIEYEMYVGETTEAYRNEYVENNGGRFVETSAGSNQWTYHKLIPATETITNEDFYNLRNIFYVSNGRDWEDDKGTSFVYRGKVFVATQTTEDISDKISFNQFVETYLNEKTFNDNWNYSYNGDWVKFVDNNGDGQVEYAFLTNSWLDEALETYTNKDGVTVTVFNQFDDNDDPRSINGEYQVRYMNGETPAVGDKVICSWIDNQILVEPANDVTKTVKAYSWRDDEITCTDDEKLGQSGIGNATDMMMYISTMDDGVEYVMYLDHFGYVRAYEIPGGTQYALVTELYYSNGNNGNLVQTWPMTVELWNGEEGKAEYTTSSNNPFNTQLFLGTPWLEVRSIASNRDYYNWLQPAIAHLGVTRNGLGPVRGDVTGVTDPTITRASQSVLWNKNYQVINNIQSFGGSQEFRYNTNGYTPAPANPENATSFTNVAVVNINDNTAALKGAAQVKLNQDGTVATYPGTNRARYAVDYIQLSTELPVAAGAVRYPIANNSGDANYVPNNNYWVNAVHDTEYYIVYNGGVYYFKDFVNMPKLDSDSVGRIHAAYAVAKDVSADSDGQPYWVADVIVFEVESWNDAAKTSVALAYYTPSRTSGDVQQVNTINSKYGLTTLIPGGKAWSADKWQWGKNWDGYGFYELWDETEPADGVMSADIARIQNAKANDRNYGKNNIHAGVVVREAYLAGNGYYIDVDTSWMPGISPRAGDDENVVSIEITDKVYSVTTDNTHQGYWYDYNVAELLRYKNTNNSQVKAGDRVIWVGDAKTDRTLNGTNFVVDLGNPVNNFEIWNTTADFLADNYPERINANENPNPTKGEWVNIMNEQAAGDVIGDAPVVTFYGKTVNTNANREFIGEVNYVEAADGTTNGIQVKDGTIVMANNSEITNDGTSASTTKTTAGVLYTGTILGKDGKYYTYKLTQKAQDKAFGNIISLDPTGITVTAHAGGTSGVIYDITVKDAEKLTITSLQTLLGASHGCKIISLKAYDLQNSPINPDQTCNTAKWIDIVLENASGEQRTVRSELIADDTLTVTPFTVTIGTGVKAYWSFQSETVNQPVIMKTATTFEVADTTATSGAQNVIFIAKGEGTWSVTENGGGGATSGSAEYFPASGLNALSQAIYEDNLTVTFLPAGSKTVSISSSDSKVTLPTVSSQTVTGTTASFTISVTNNYKPVLTLTNRAKADAVKGTVGATTTEWTINISDIGASGTAVTVTSAPASYTLNADDFAASETAGAITISGIDVALATSDALAANDASVAYSIEMLATGSAQWTSIATGTIQNAVVNTDGGDIFGAGGAALSGTYGVGTYRVVATVTIASTNQTVGPFTTDSIVIS